MFTITSSNRFDDVDEDAGFTYHGWNYEVAGAAALFRVRVYDDKPGMLTVISPTNARVMPQARELLDYLLAADGGDTASFYEPISGTYRAVDTLTLEFL